MYFRSRKTRGLREMWPHEANQFLPTSHAQITPWRRGRQAPSRRASACNSTGSGAQPEAERPAKEYRVFRIMGLRQQLHDACSGKAALLLQRSRLINACLFLLRKHSSRCCSSLTLRRRSVASGDGGNSAVMKLRARASDEFHSAERDVPCAEDGSFLFVRPAMSDP